MAVLSWNTNTEPVMSAESLCIGQHHFSDITPSISHNLHSDIKMAILHRGYSNDARLGSKSKIWDFHLDEGLTLFKRNNNRLQLNESLLT